MMRGNNMTPEERAAMPKITKEVVFRAAGYIKPYWKQVAFVLLILGIATVMNVLPTILTGMMIDKGFLAGDFNVVLILIGLSFGLFIVSNLLSVLENYINAWVSQHIVFDMRNQMYKHLEHMSHRFFTTEKPGDIITRMTGDINGVNGVISNTLPNVFRNIVLLITVLTMMFTTNWVLSIVGIIFIPAFIVPTRRVGRRRFEFATATQKKHDEMNQQINETLSVSGSLLVKIFTKEDKEYAKYKGTNRELIRLNLRENLIGRWFRMFVGVVSNMGPMTIYLVGGFLMLMMSKEGEPPLITLGQITIMVGLVNRVYNPIGAMLNLHVDLTRSMAYFARIFTYFDKPHEVKNKDGAKVLDAVEGTIEFEDVTFGYEEGKGILKGVSFNVESGKTVAIVGPSGAGKSTLLYALSGMDKPTLGAIYFAQREISGLSNDGLAVFRRDNCGFVFQQMYLLDNMSVMDNILAAGLLTNRNKKEVMRRAQGLLKQLGLDEGTWRKFPAQVSGGEAQRAAIARALINTPKIVFADEPTGALNSANGLRVLDALTEINKNGQTVVMVTHDLRSAYRGNRVLYIRDGGIVGECDLGAYDKGNASRHAALKSFLAEMGW
jgi:ATP-binding cassette subfamily B protein